MKIEFEVSDSVMMGEIQDILECMFDNHKYLSTAADILGVSKYNYMLLADVLLKDLNFIKSLTSFCKANLCDSLVDTLDQYEKIPALNKIMKDSWDIVNKLHLEDDNKKREEDIEKAKYLLTSNGYSVIKEEAKEVKNETN